MAKKSAKSKGYRKTIGKKPYLSRKDIVWLCVIVAALAVGAFLLFSYDDGALKTKDGVIVGAGEDWIVINGSNNRSGVRYFKLGEAREMEGYTRESEVISADANLKQFIYTPTDEAGAIRNISMMGSPYAPKTIAEYSAKLYASMDGVQMSDIREGQTGEWSYIYYTYTRAYRVDEADEAETEAEATEETPNRFEQAITAYLPASHNGCVVVSVEVEVPSEADWLSEDDLTTAVAQAMAAIKLEN